MVQISSKGHKATEWQSSWTLLTLEFGGSIKGLLFLRIFKKQNNNPSKTVKSSKHLKLALLYDLGNVLTLAWF